MSRPTPLRCAIYTRKSSEEGLDQSFNSLHAQREACEAYILSQAGEGWTLIKTAYDDGGFSGGNMERPGLKALLADIEWRRIDIVVVYKVDRLTRSLTDFAKIVDAFDAKGVSFVSVTQAFSTVTSMGRLTLNVLLSFAQFEREVTGERIRDKIAASKAKGIWMGGNLPLGYDTEDRKLVINPPEASLVRHIFERYLALGSVHTLKEELDQDGHRSKRRVSAGGNVTGGEPFSRGALFHLLRNPIYIGKISHKGVLSDGQHAAIIAPEVFSKVQRSLQRAAQAKRDRPARAGASPLTGLIFDADGHPMSPAAAYGRSRRLYRYYVSAPLQRGQRLDPDTDSVRRICSPALEAMVLDRLSRLAGDAQGTWDAHRDRLVRVDIGAQQVTILARPDAVKTPLGRLRQRLAGDDLDLLDEETLLRIRIAVRPVFRGGRTWLVTPQDAATVAQPRADAALIKALRVAHAGLVEMNASPVMGDEQIQRACSPADSYVRRLVRLAFLAPDIQRAILEGRQPPGLTLQQVMDREIPAAWSDQRMAFGFAARG